MTDKKKTGAGRRRSRRKDFEPRDHEWGVHADPDTNKRIGEVLGEECTLRDYPVKGGGTRNMWIVSWEFLMDLLPRWASKDYRFSIWIIDHPGEPARRADEIVRDILKRKLIGNNAPKPMSVLFDMKEKSPAA